MSARTGKRLGLLALCLLAAAGFASLGVWQLERLAWKRELIARVDARLRASPVPAPGAAEWPLVEPREAEYRRVRVSGTYLHDRVTLVDALTERGAGYWVLTPLQGATGTVLVNRGFVPPEGRDLAARAVAQQAGEVTVVGLLRASEPGGRILRPNDPAQERWFSRDVAAIAAARGLGAVAPYFIDAEAAPGPDGAPIGGLTVVHFRNAHLAYAATWFALALLSAGGLVLVLREGSARGAARG